MQQIYRFLHPKFQNLFLDYKVDLRPRYGYGSEPHPELHNIIGAQRHRYEELLHKALEHKSSILAIQDHSDEKDPKQPTWNNGFLPGLDIIMLYTLVAEYHPSQFIEIGSGNSTKVVYKAIQDHNLQTSIISIDPQPRVEIDHLTDEVIRQPFESIDYNRINALADGDFLFIDNSHRILPNSDAMVFYMEILPRLKPGVIIHLHDIYLPYDYPQFMCDRYYSEQYGLAFYLLANSQKFRPLLANYFISEDHALSSILDPLWLNNLGNVERHGGSFWLEIA